MNKLEDVVRKCVQIQQWLDFNTFKSKFKKSCPLAPKLRSWKESEALIKTQGYGKQVIKHLTTIEWVILTLHPLTDSGDNEVFSITRVERTGAPSLWWCLGSCISEPHTHIHTHTRNNDCISKLTSANVTRIFSTKWIHEKLHLDKRRDPPRLTMYLLSL